MIFFKKMKGGLFLAALFLTQNLFSALSLNPEISRSRNLYNLKDGNFSESLDFQLATVYSFSAGSVSNKIAYSKNLNDDSPAANDFSDSNLTFSKSAFEWTMLDSVDVKLSPSVTAIIPVSKNSRQNDRLQSALILGGNYSFSFQNVKGLSLGAGLSLGRNFHSFDKNENGDVLNQYSSNQNLSVSYSISAVSFALSYVHKNRWTYQGVMRESFELSEGIELALSKVTIGLGHTNAGSAIKANGYESNIAFFNDDNSVVYLSVGFLWNLF